MMNDSNNDNLNLVAILLAIAALLLLLYLSLTACSTNHYFSVNAEEMTNPKIEYHDSASVENPF